MPTSKQKVGVAEMLKSTHFIHEYKVLDDGRFGVLRIYLKYHDGKPVIRHLERVSKPGRRRYVQATEIPRVRNGLGVAILSTSRGLLTGRQAREQRIGGELMAYVW